MSYSKEMHKKVRGILAERRQISADRNEHQQQELYKKHPKLKEIENQLNQTGRDLLERSLLRE